MGTKHLKELQSFIRLLRELLIRRGAIITAADDDKRMADVERLGSRAEGSSFFFKSHKKSLDSRSFFES